MNHECKCGGTIPAGRWDIGFELCLEAKEVALTLQPSWLHIVDLNVMEEVESDF